MGQAIIRKSKTRWPLKRPQQWYVVVHAANGKKMFTSEMYTNYGDAFRAAEFTNLPIVNRF